MKKTYKEIVSFLEENGFEYDRTNTKSVDFYRHAHLREQWVTQAIDERGARNIRKEVQKALGLETDRDRSKRSPEAVRLRQSAERDRIAADIQRHREEIADLLSQRDKRMDGLGRILTDSELLAIERLIETRQRELLGWQRLMTEIPTTNAHSGRPGAQHRS